MTIKQNIYMGLPGNVGDALGVLSGAHATAVGEHWVKLLNVRGISKDVKMIELSGSIQ